MKLSSNKIMEKVTRSEEKCHIMLAYFKLFNLTIEQYRSSNGNCGAYFWLIKAENNKHIIYCHIGEKLIKYEICLTEKTMHTLEEMLKNTGYETSKTENNNLLITISKKNIITACTLASNDVHEENSMLKTDEHIYTKGK